MSDAVRYEREGQVGVITLCRPDNRNSMTAELLDGFERAVAAARADTGARAVVVTGTGSCFSAGADFKAQMPGSAPGGDPTAGAQRGDAGLDPAERSFAMYQPFLAVLDLEVPVVAALNGHAVGGGFGLALLCDVRVASRAGKYGANFCRLGLAPGLGISYLLPRLVGLARASELLYTGRLVSGDEAAAIGLVNQALEPAEVLPRAMQLAGEIAASAPLAVRATKAALRRGLGWEVREHARGEAAAQARTLTTTDFAEGVAALLEKRAPKFTGK